MMISICLTYSVPLLYSAGRKWWIIFVTVTLLDNEINGILYVTSGEL